MWRRQCRRRSHTFSSPYSGCYSSPDTWWTKQNTEFRTCHWSLFTRRYVTRDALYTIIWLLCKHKPYDAIQAVDLLIRVVGGWLFRHDQGGYGALQGWSSTRTETAAGLCCFTCLQSTCLSDTENIFRQTTLKKEMKLQLQNRLHVSVYLRGYVF